LVCSHEGRKASQGNNRKLCTVLLHSLYGEAYIGETPLYRLWLVDTPREMWMVTREEKGFMDADVALAV
jgi:hypothetical protein